MNFGFWFWFAFGGVLGLKAMVPIMVWVGLLGGASYVNVMY